MSNESSVSLGGFEEEPHPVNKKSRAYYKLRGELLFTIPDNGFWKKVGVHEKGLLIYNDNKRTSFVLYAESRYRSLDGYLNELLARPNAKKLAEQYIIERDLLE